MQHGGRIQANSLSRQVDSLEDLPSFRSSLLGKLGYLDRGTWNGRMLGCVLTLLLCQRAAIVDRVPRHLRTWYLNDVLISLKLV